MLIVSPLSENSSYIDSADIKSSSVTLEMNDDEKVLLQLRNHPSFCSSLFVSKEQRKFEKISVGSVRFQKSLFVQHFVKQ